MTEPRRGDRPSREMVCRPSGAPSSSASRTRGSALTPLARGPLLAPPLANIGRPSGAEDTASGPPPHLRSEAELGAEADRLHPEVGKYKPRVRRAQRVAQPRRAAQVGERVPG